jgi:hypothetical protein
MVDIICLQFGLKPYRLIFETDSMAVYKVWLRIPNWKIFDYKLPDFRNFSFQKWIKKPG